MAKCVKSEAVVAESKTKHRVRRHVRKEVLHGQVS